MISPDQLYTKLSTQTSSSSIKPKHDLKAFKFLKKLPLPRSLLERPLKTSHNQNIETVPTFRGIQIRSNSRQQNLSNLTVNFPSVSRQSQIKLLQLPSLKNGRIIAPIDLKILRKELRSVAISQNQNSNSQEFIQNFSLLRSPHDISSQKIEVQSQSFIKGLKPHFESFNNNDLKLDENSKKNSQIKLILLSPNNSHQNFKQSRHTRNLKHSTKPKLKILKSDLINECESEMRSIQERSFDNKTEKSNGTLNSSYQHRKSRDFSTDSVLKGEYNQDEEGSKKNKLRIFNFSPTYEIRHQNKNGIHDIKAVRKSIARQQSRKILKCAKLELNIDNMLQQRRLQKVDYTENIRASIDHDITPKQINRMPSYESNLPIIQQVSLSKDRSSVEDQIISKLRPHYDVPIEYEVEICKSKELSPNHKKYNQMKQKQSSKHRNQQVSMSVILPDIISVEKGSHTLQKVKNINNNSKQSKHEIIITGQYGGNKKRLTMLNFGETMY